MTCVPAQRSPRRATPRYSKCFRPEVPRMRQTSLGTVCPLKGPPQRATPRYSTLPPPRGPESACACRRTCFCCMHTAKNLYINFSSFSFLVSSNRTRLQAHVFLLRVRCQHVRSHLGSCCAAKCMRLQARVDLEGQLDTNIYISLDRCLANTLESADARVYCASIATNECAAQM